MTVILCTCTLYINFSTLANINLSSLFAVVLSTGKFRLLLDLIGCQGHVGCWRAAIPWAELVQVEKHDAGCMKWVQARCAVRYLNCGIAGNTFLAMCLRVIGPFETCIWMNIFIFFFMLWETMNQWIDSSQEAFTFLFMVYRELWESSSFLLWVILIGCLKWWLAKGFIGLSIENQIGG